MPNILEILLKKSKKEYYNSFNCYKNFHEKINKLSQAIKQLSEQIEDIISLLDDSKTIQQEIDDNYQKVTSTCRYPLDEIFSELKAQNIHPSLVKEDTNTLYDFIDEKAVEQIHNEFLTEITNFTNIRNSSSALLTALQKNFNEIKKLAVKDDIQLLLKQCYYNIKKQEELYKKSSSIFHQSIISENSISSSGDEKTKEIEIMKENFENIIYFSKENDNIIDKYNSLLHQTQLYFSGIEQFSTQIKHAFQDLESMQLHFKESREIIFILYEEFNNLAAWYQKFRLAYISLLTEIERRNDYHSNFQQEIHQMQAQLDKRYTLENQLRMKFFEEHGRYLPTLLCPGLQETAFHCQIVPNLLSTSLPTLS